MSRRGVAVGVPVAVFGLGAFVYSQIIRVFFIHEDGLDVNGSLQMMGLIAFFLNLICSFLLKDQRSNDGYTMNKDEILIQNEEIRELLSSEISTPEPILLERSSFESSKLRITPYSRNLLYDPPEHTPIERPTISIFQSVDGYLLGSILFLCAGIGLMYINNCGSIIKSLVSNPLDSDKYSTFHVGAMSISSFAGRLFTGTLSDYFTTRFGLSRLFWPFLASFFLLIASIYAGWILTEISQLFLLTFLIGFGYGILWTAIPVLVGQYFGSEKFAYNWGWFQVLPAFGGQLTSAIFGYVIDTCSASLCFTTSFKIMTGISGLALVCIRILYKRSTNPMHQL